VRVGFVIVASLSTYLSVFIYIHSFIGSHLIKTNVVDALSFECVIYEFMRVHCSLCTDGRLRKIWDVW
jgi:hypothetical protein